MCWHRSQGQERIKAVRWGGLDLGGGFGLRGEEQDYYWQVRLGLQRTKATVN